MEYILLSLMETGGFGPYAGHALLCFIIVFGVQMMKKSSYNLDTFSYPPVWYLVLFSGFYVLLTTISISNISAYFLAPIFAFMAGWCIMDMAKKNPEACMKKIFVAMIIGFAVHAVANSLYNQESSRSEIVDAFTGYILSATCAGGVNTMSFSLLLYFVLEKKKSIKWLGFLCILISLWYAAILASRTQFVIIIAVFAVMFLFYLIENKNAYTTFKIIGVFIAGIVIISLIYYYDLFSLRTAVESSNMYLRMQQSQENSDSIRYERFFEGIVSLFEKPLGNPDSKYFHNFWLDIGRKAGILPVFFMLCYSIITTYHAIKIFKNKKVDRLVRFMILSVYLGFTINLFVEPALEGMLDFVLTFMIINGAVERYFYSLAERKNAEVTIK